MKNIKVTISLLMALVANSAMASGWSLSPEKNPYAFGVGLCTVAAVMYKVYAWTSYASQSEVSMQDEIANAERTYAENLQKRRAERKQILVNVNDGAPATRQSVGLQVKQSRKVTFDDGPARAQKCGLEHEVAQRSKE